MNPFFFKYKISYSNFESTNSLYEIKNPTAREFVHKNGNNKSLEISNVEELSQRKGFDSSTIFIEG